MVRTEQPGIEAAEVESNEPVPIGGAEVVDQILEQVRHLEGSRTLALESPVFNAVDEWTDPHKGMQADVVKFSEVTIFSTPGKELAMAVGEGSAYRQELICLPLPEGCSDEELLGKISGFLGNIEPAGAFRFPSILFVNRHGEIGAFDSSYGAILLEDIEMRKFVSSPTQYDERLLQSIWDPSPLKVAGPRYNPDCVRAIVDEVGSKFGKA